MKNLIALLFVTITFNVSSHNNTEQLPAYGKLLEKAAADMKGENYEAAKSTLIHALSVNVHEGLTFDIYAKLAIVSQKMNDENSFLLYKKYYETALSVFVGIFSCNENDDRVFISNSNNTPLNEHYANKIASEMCFGEQEIYLDRSLEGRLLVEAKYYELLQELAVYQ
jgi:hypothetical protein